MAEKERVQKVLAAWGVASRRKAEELIAQGRVTVNGRPVKLGDGMVPGKDLLAVDGEPVAQVREKVYLALHKPRGFVTTLRDERDRKCVAQLVEDVPVRVYPVGRLDKDSEGLLLMTNDGPLAHRLLAPKRHVDKVYYVEVDGILDQQDVEAVSQGIVLRDGYQCLPGKLELLEGNTSAYITIREGKYHQIKRMMAARGKPVSYLKRIRFGPLQLDPQLDKGGWRALTQEELQELFRQ